MAGALHPINLSPADVISVLQQRKTSVRVTDKLNSLNDEPGKYKFIRPYKIDPEDSLTTYRFSYEARKGVDTETGVYSTYEEGDILWVREDWEHYSNAEENKDYKDAARDSYLNDPEAKPWTSIFFMPKAACRIFLKITKIRPERLCGISAADAIKEGVESVDAYRSLWQSLNGPQSWDRNEWVFVIEFERIDTGKYAAENKQFASWLAKATKKKINYSTLLKEMWKKSEE